MGGNPCRFVLDYPERQRNNLPRHRLLYSLINAPVSKRAGFFAVVRVDTPCLQGERQESRPRGK